MRHINVQPKNPRISKILYQAGSFDITESGVVRIFNTDKELMAAHSDWEKVWYSPETTVELVSSESKG